MTIRSSAAVLGRTSLLLSLLVAPLLGLGPTGPEPGWADEPPVLEYRTSAEVRALLRDLANRALGAGIPATVETYGVSQGGRDLLALRLGRAAPVVLVHGGLGARDAAATVACLHLAAHLVEGPPGADAVTWLLVPAPNPDALDAFLAGLAPAGGGRVDRDKDDLRGEDGPSDVDGDGEILWMRRPSARGAWAPADEQGNGDLKVRGDPRLLEERGVDARRSRSYEVWREGLDDDGDGDVNEDAPYLDLTRQLAGFWDDKAPWRGDGPFPGYAPEARALMETTYREAGLVAWYGFAGEGAFVLRASEQGKEADADDALYDRIGRVLKERTGLDTHRASRHLGADANPGSDLDWAAVHLGVPAFRLPVWSIPRQEQNARERDARFVAPAPDELDWLLWADRELKGKGFKAWTAFDHPTLGKVEIGGWLRFTRHEPPARLLGTAVAKIGTGPLVQTSFVPRLHADVAVHARGEGLVEITARALNRGGGPTDTLVRERHRRSVGVRLSFEPAVGVDTLAGPDVFDAGRLETGRASEPARWLVRVGEGSSLGRIRVRHPKADPAIVEVRR